jgi:hypothetical protein
VRAHPRDGADGRASGHCRRLQRLAPQGESNAVDELGVTEVFEAVRGRSARTFPSVMPVFRLDRIYARGLSIVDAHIHYAYPSRTDLRSRGACSDVRPQMEASREPVLPGTGSRSCAAAANTFPALVHAIDRAEREVWLETYIYADDDVGRIITAALVRARSAAIVVRVLVDGWGRKHYLTRRSKRELVDNGVAAQVPPEVAPWQFARTGCGGCIASSPTSTAHRVRRRHQHHRRRQHTGPEAAARRFRAAHRGPAARPIVRTMQRVWAINELVQFQQSDVPLFPSPRARSARRADGEIPDPRQPAPPPRHRDALPRGDPDGEARDPDCELVFLSRHPLPPRADRRGASAASRHAAAAGRVEYLLLHYASRALYGSCSRRRQIQDTTSRSCTRRCRDRRPRGRRSARRTSTRTAC